MLVDISKIQITNDILERGTKWRYNNVSLKNAVKQDKYLVLNWDNLSLEKLKEVLFSLDKGLIQYYLYQYNIEDKEIVFNMLEYFELPDEGHLWNSLVDNRVISNEYYLSNSYRENFEIWYKMVYSKEIEKLPTPTSHISNEEIIQRMDVKHVSKKQQQAENRKRRVFEWLEEIIDFNFDDTTIPNTSYRFLTFKFKEGVTCLEFGISKDILNKIPEDLRENYIVNLEGEKAFIYDISDSRINSPQFSNNMTDLINANNNIPKNFIGDYVSKWFKNKLPDWKERIS